MNQVFKNHFYALKLMWKLCKSRVIHVALQTMLVYFEWVFYDAYFIRYIIGAIQNENQFSQIMMFIGLTIIIFCATNLYQNYVDNVVIPLTDNLIYQRLYGIIYKKSVNVELRCFEDTEFYNKYTLATKDAAENLTGLLNHFFGIIFGFIAAIVVFIVMFQIDHFAVIFVIAPIIGNFIFGTWLNRIHIKVYKESIPANRKLDYVNRVIHLCDYAKEIRLSKVYNLMKKKYQEAVKEAIQINDKYAKKAIVVFWFQTYLTYNVIFQGVILYGVIRTAVSHTMTLADLAVLSSVMMAATWILIIMCDNVMNYNKKGLLVNNIKDFLSYEEVIPENYDGLIPDEKIDYIEFKNVAFSYDGEKNVISHLSLRIEGNSSVALVGHNGAGKSTIIKLLFRMYDPTEGEIIVNGHNIKEYNLQAYRKLFSTAFQDYKIFAMSVRENVLMRKADPDNKEEEEALVIDALKKAGIYEKIESLPKGIDTVLTKEFDEDGVVLSGGQYQKIVIARAFARNSFIKIFDEPSSALDPIAESELFDSILEDGRDKTLLFISHRLSSVRNADYVYMLEQGTLIEEGTHDFLMNQQGSYANMFNKQAKNYLMEV